MVNFIQYHEKSITKFSNIIFFKNEILKVSSDVYRIFFGKAEKQNEGTVLDNISDDEEGSEENKVESDVEISNEIDVKFRKNSEGFLNFIYFQKL